MSHCVSVIKATNVKANAYSSPNSRALLSPNKKIKKKAILLNNSTESYLMQFKMFILNVNLLQVFTAIYKVNNNIEIISDLDIDGRVLIKKHSEINAIVIDDEIIWYGSINPFSWAKKDDTIIRLVDMEYVKEIFNE